MRRDRREGSWGRHGEGGGHFATCWKPIRFPRFGAADYRHDDARAAVIKLSHHTAIIIAAIITLLLIIITIIIIIIILLLFYYHYYCLLISLSSLFMIIIYELASISSMPTLH